LDLSLGDKILPPNPNPRLNRPPLPYFSLLDDMA
jgi:hypothetical protein